MGVRRREGYLEKVLIVFIHTYTMDLNLIADQGTDLYHSHLGNDRYLRCNEEPSLGAQIQEQLQKQFRVYGEREKYRKENIRKVTQEKKKKPHSNKRK